MWPFSKIKRLQQKCLQFEDHLTEVLEVVLNKLQVKGEYVYNEPGTGSITYNVAGRSFEFNQFPNVFSGFFINKKSVSFKKFLGELDKTWWIFLPRR